MPHSATIKSLPRAFRMMKAMQAQGIEWGEDYRQAAGVALKDVLEGGMAERVDRHLEEMALREQADRRNGSYRRWLMTELGAIELSVPRTRSFSALVVVRAYARRSAHIDRLILACFVLGLSTRKAAVALAPILGRRISAGTVSHVAKTLDAAVEAFHRRPLEDVYPVLMLDGVVLSRKTGCGAIRRPVLVALGLRADGRKEIIDYRLACAESAAQWELFLTDLYRRGLEGKARRSRRSGCAGPISGSSSPRRARSWPPCMRARSASRRTTIPGPCASARARPVPSISARAKGSSWARLGWPAPLVASPF